MNSLSEIFWRRYPALYLALCFLLGLASACHLYLFTLTLFIPKKALWGVVLMGLIYFKCLYPSLPPGGEGVAVFQIEEVKRHKGPFHSSLVYVGKVKAFRQGSRAWYRIPCRLYMHHKKNRPKANCEYLIPSATLIKISPFRYILKGAGEWLPVKRTFSFAEWRFQAKERVRNMLRAHYTDKRSYALMSVLFTGDSESSILSYQFGKVGVQHLLAISGFHFAILSLFLALLLKLFLPKRGVIAGLIPFLCAYLFYMGGATPSISRAWIGMITFTIGILFSFRPTALNSLGISLLFALLSPLTMANISFQLSFSATLCILIFYKKFQKTLELLLPKRPFDQLQRMPLLDQGGYLICSYIRNVLALNGAVLTFTLPLLIFHFHSFPLISLIYNLFIPPLFVFLMGGAILGLFIPGVSFINGHYTSLLLDLIANAPKKLGFCLGIKTTLMLATSIVLALLYCRWRKNASHRNTPLHTTEHTQAYHSRHSDNT